MDIFTDGGARGNPGLSGIGFVFKDGDKVIKEGSYFIGERTNNEAEYLALIKALEEASEYNDINIYSDSELIVNQVKGTYKIKKPHLQKLCHKVRELLSNFNHTFIRVIPREENKEADKLVNKAIDGYLEGEVQEYKFNGLAEQNSLF